MGCYDLPGPGDFGGYADDPRAPNYLGDPPEIEPLDSPIITKLIEDLGEIQDKLCDAIERGDMEMARCVADQAARLAINARKAL